MCGALIAQSVKQRTACWMASVRFPARARDFSQPHCAQTGSGVYSTSYLMDSWVVFLGGKATGA
jgi:hypothetical protein